MPIGKVKWFNDQNGFGFIAPDDGSEELFFHWSSIIGGYMIMVPNEAVAYDKMPTDKGPRAANVQKLSGNMPLPAIVSSRDDIKEALDAFASGRPYSSTKAPKAEAPATSHKAKVILSIFLFGTVVSIGLGFITPMLGGICFTFTVTAMWFQWKKKS
jgi:CspA family cold shock protein